MIKEMLAFTGAFALCAAIGAPNAGCSDEGGCPPIYEPALPATQQGLPITNGSVQTDSGPAIDLRGGTLDVTGDKVRLHYTWEGVAHEVVYGVMPRPGPR
jgi:hypothetical protein